MFILMGENDFLLCFLKKALKNISAFRLLTNISFLSEKKKKIIDASYVAISSLRVNFLLDISVFISEVLSFTGSQK